MSVAKGHRVAAEEPAKRRDLLDAIDIAATMEVIEDELTAIAK